MKEHGLTDSLEDYLKEIYILSKEDENVRVTDVAKTLGISKPSVNRAMNSLKELGLLSHEHYGKILLTDIGKEAAEGIVETNKVIYRFLTEVLGVESSVAYDEAHCMEHGISKGTRKKLKKLLKKKK